MGEYIAVDGQPTKLGTCESLFYVRFETLRDWVRTGRAGHWPGNLEPAGYLDPTQGFRYRFPFPDEDGRDWHGDYDRGYMLHAPPACFADMEHHEATAAIEARNAAAPRVTLRVACPQAHAHEGDGGRLELVAQKQWADALWTVARCPYCGALWRMPPAYAEALAAHHADTTDPELRKALRRMLEGYARS